LNFGLQAQTKQVINQSLYWVRYYNQLSINKKLTWHNEIKKASLATTKLAVFNQK
jgi:hypothetical protein